MNLLGASPVDVTGDFTTLVKNVGVSCSEFASDPTWDYTGLSW